MRATTNVIFGLLVFGVTACDGTGGRVGLGASALDTLLNIGVLTFCAWLLVIVFAPERQD